MDQLCKIFSEFKLTKILINKEELTLAGIKQYYILVENKEWKYETLCELYDIIITSQSIIYTNYKKELNILYKKLINSICFGVLSSKIMSPEVNA
mgnify:CR=1 FL=1